jgi:hypothetical protein
MPSHRSSIRPSLRSSLLLTVVLLGSVGIVASNASLARAQPAPEGEDFFFIPKGFETAGKPRWCTDPEAGREAPLSGAGVVSSSGRAEISSNTDMLTIYDSAGGRVGAQLWRVISGGGLAGEPPRLYQEFRADVERTPDPAKAEPAKKKE